MATKSHLKAFVHNNDGFVEFLLRYPVSQPRLSSEADPRYHVGDDAGQQEILLVLVGALLLSAVSSKPVRGHAH